MKSSDQKARVFETWIEKGNGTTADGEPYYMLKAKAYMLKNEEIFKLLIDIASGRQTKNEQNGYRDISIFKDGVIM